MEILYAYLWGIHTLLISKARVGLRCCFGVFGKDIVVGYIRAILHRTNLRWEEIGRGIPSLAVPEDIYLILTVLATRLAHLHTRSICHSVDEDRTLLSTGLRLKSVSCIVLLIHIRLAPGSYSDIHTYITSNLRPTYQTRRLISLARSTNANFQ